MRRFSVVACVLGLSTILAGCLVEEAPIGTEDQHATDSWSHARAVQGCQDELGQNLEAAQDDVDRHDALNDWGWCVEGANYKVVSQLEHGSDDFLSLRTNTQEYRDVGKQMCGELTGHPSVPEHLQPHYYSECAGTRESHLAKLMDAYVSMSSQSQSPVGLDGRERYPSCFAAHDQLAPTDPVDAVNNLADCIVEQIAAAAQDGKLGDPIVRDAGLTKALCANLAVADQSGRSAEQADADCRVDAALQLSELVDGVFPVVCSLSPIQCGDAGA